MYFKNGREIVFSDGTSIVTREKIEYVENDDDSFHRLQNDESLDEIAHRYYKDQVIDAHRYWWIIADANGIHNPLQLDQYLNTELVIPDILRFKLQYQQ